MCAAMTASLTACGNQNADSDADTGEEYVYVPEYIELSGEDEDTWFSNLRIEGNTLYYDSYNYDEATMTSTEVMCEYSLADGSVKETPLPTVENGGISAHVKDESGNIYAIVEDYSAENMSADGYSIPDMYLHKYDAQGAVVFEKDITDTVSEFGEYIYVQNMLLDSQNNLYICLESGVLLMTAEGEEHGYVDVSSSGWINNMAQGKDGKVYICYYDNTSATGGMVLADIDFATKKIGTVYQNVPNMNGRMSVGAEEEFMGHDGSTVYEYDLDTQTANEVLKWLDCDINGSYVENVSAMEDGNLVAVVNDWETNKTEVVKLVKTAASEVVQKEEILIGVLYENQELQAAAVAFNKTNDTYRITIKSYLDTNNWTETSYQDAITNINNDITSGSNCPDILDLSQLNVQQLAAKGVLEDLTPYLEKSTAFSKEDFIDGLLDGFTYDGALVTIPSTFDLNTVVGKTSLVGDEMGWSLDEMMEFAKKYPDAQLFDGVVQATMLSYCMMFNQDAFIDWTKGECYFNSEEFKKLLEFVAMFPAEIDWENYEGGAKVEERQANQILLDAAGIYDFQEIQMYPAMFGEEVTFVGFPTIDGSVGCMLSASNLYGITSKSDNKEGAWAFLEGYLESATDSMFSWGFPALKEKFEEKIAEITKVEYLLDENGEQVLDENGEHIVLGGTSSIGWEDWEYTYHTPTEEEIAQIRELISVAKPISTMMGSDEILNIITEEAQAYLTGQKSIDEVVDIIQSRAQIYISENS